MSHSRLRREISNIDLNSPLFKVEFESLHEWKVKLKGIENSFFGENVWAELSIIFPHDYPFTPPEVYFLYPETQHPYVSMIDKRIVNIDILYNQWSPALTGELIIISLSGLFSSPVAEQLEKDWILEIAIQNERITHLIEASINTLPIHLIYNKYIADKIRNYLFKYFYRLVFFGEEQNITDQRQNNTTIEESTIEESTIEDHKLDFEYDDNVIFEKNIKRKKIKKSVKNRFLKFNTQNRESNNFWDFPSTDETTKNHTISISNQKNTKEDRMLEDDNSESDNIPNTWEDFLEED